jgi:hypothetical protein
MSQDITTLREHLFATLTGVKDGSIDIERARAVNEIGKTLVDTARVEVDYLRATGGGESEFLAGSTSSENLPPGITGRTVHKLR